jgi:hypothetical protein
LLIELLYRSPIGDGWKIDVKAIFQSAVSSAAELR